MDVAKGMRLSKIFPSISCGVPVIYAGAGEAAEMIDKHECGITVEPERPELLARTIEHLAESEELRERLGRTGRNLIDGEYSWSLIIKRWLKELGMEGAVHDDGSVKQGRQADVVLGANYD
jgi:glycosyltransferase involved in cell wall biosynthesis